MHFHRHLCQQEQVSILCIYTNVCWESLLYMREKSCFACYFSTSTANSGMFPQLSVCLSVCATSPHCAAGSLPEGLLRLADQDTQAHHVEGRPEVYHSGEWGTICNNGWDSNDAHAVCQQLGFSGPDQTCCSSQGSGTGRVWLENLQCDITDDWISQDCDVSTWGSTCAHSQDAGVRCERELSPALLVQYDAQSASLLKGFHANTVCQLLAQIPGLCCFCRLSCYCCLCRCT